MSGTLNPGGVHNGVGVVGARVDGVVERDGDLGITHTASTLDPMNPRRRRGPANRGGTAADRGLARRSVVTHDTGNAGGAYGQACVQGRREHCAGRVILDRGLDLLELPVLVADRRTPLGQTTTALLSSSSRYHSVSTTGGGAAG
jgi:hypothetical protein